jgi:hypothetical protein
MDGHALNAIGGFPQIENKVQKWHMRCHPTDKNIGISAVLELLQFPFLLPSHSKDIIRRNGENGLLYFPIRQ